MLLTVNSRLRNSSWKGLKTWILLFDASCCLLEFPENLAVYYAAGLILWGSKEHPEQQTPIYLTKRINLLDVVIRRFTVWTMLSYRTVAPVIYGIELDCMQHGYNDPITILFWRWILVGKGNEYECFILLKKCLSFQPKWEWPISNLPF